MNNVQALIAARNQFALRNLTQESLRLILPSYYEAMDGVLRLLKPMPGKELSVEREFWLKQQLANIRGQFKALGDRVEEVVPAADLRAWEIGLQNADAMLKGSGIDSPLDAIIDSGQSELFIKESNPLGEFIRPQITPQQVVASVKKEGFSKLLAGHTKSYTLEDALPAMLKSQANIIEKKLRTGFLLGQTNDEIVRNILTDRRGRAQVETIVRTSMMEASQAAHDAFYQANDDFSWTDDDGNFHEVKLIKGYEWDASLDDRVCPICAPLDGITRENREDMPTHLAHYGCRCQILPMTGTTKALREQGVLQKRTVGEQLQGMTDEQKRGVLGNQKMVDQWNKKITQAKYQKDPQRLVRDLLRPGMAAEVKVPAPKVKRAPKKKPTTAKSKSSAPLAKRQPDKRTAQQILDDQVAAADKRLKGKKAEVKKAVDQLEGLALQRELQSQQLDRLLGYNEEQIKIRSADRIARRASSRQKLAQEATKRMTEEEKILKPLREATLRATTPEEVKAADAAYLKALKRFDKKRRARVESALQDADRAVGMSPATVKARAAQRKARATADKQKARVAADAEYDQWEKAFNREFPDSVNAERISRPRLNLKTRAGKAEQKFREAVDSGGESQIKKAWLKAMQANHPDAGGTTDAAARINAEYQEWKRGRLLK